MKYLKMLGLAALSAMALMAVVGAGTASATTLKVNGVTQTKSVTISASLATGTSAILKDNLFETINTCTGSSVSGKTETLTGATVTGKATVSFSGCKNSVTVHNSGTLHVAASGTHNGSVSSSGAEITTDGPFGYVNCKTEGGTPIGTLTGTTESTKHATMHINANLKCSGISANWTGTYTVTSPTGLSVTA